MFDFTDSQLELLMSRFAYKKILFEIDATTPLRYCTGLSDHTYSSDVYRARGMTLGEIALQDESYETYVTLDNVDAELSTANFSDRLSGYDATMYFFLSETGQNWTLVLTLTWSVENCEWTNTQFKVNLTWGYGVRPRAGLEVASRRCALAAQWNTDNSPKGGPLCGYNGAADRCTGTWDDCKTKSNTSKFRGFRLAPAPGYTLHVNSGSFQFDGDPYQGEPSPGSVADTREGGYQHFLRRRFVYTPPPVSRFYDLMRHQTATLQAE